MSDHKFKIGQQVNYTSGPLGSVKGTIFTITQLLPQTAPVAVEPAAAQPLVEDVAADAVEPELAAGVADAAEMRQPHRKPPELLKVLYSQRCKPRRQ